MRPDLISQGDGWLVEEVSLGPQALNGWRQSVGWKLPNIMQCRRKCQRPRENREKLAALLAVATLKAKFLGKVQHRG